MYHRLRKIILNAPDGSPRRVGHVELVSIHLETVLVSLQYRCTVCAESTIGSEIVLNAHDDTPR
jgi:hypothetical protein